MDALQRPVSRAVRRGKSRKSYGWPRQKGIPKLRAHQSWGGMHHRSLGIDSLPQMPQNARMLRMIATVGVLALGALPGSVVLQAKLRAPQAAAPAVAPTAPSAALSTTASTAELRKFLDGYCVGCHNEKRKSAELALDSVDLQKMGEHARVLETVIRKIRVGAMPPVGSRRPGPDVYAATIAGLEQGLDRAAAASPNPGRVPIHRLNRMQYSNAIRDLFGVQIDTMSMLPADNSGYGFDNIADVLTMSPGLLDRYLVAAAKVSRLVVRDDQIRPSVSSYTLPYLSLGQDQRMS